MLNLEIREKVVKSANSISIFPHKLSFCRPPLSPPPPSFMNSVQVAGLLLWNGVALFSKYSPAVPHAMLLLCRMPCCCCCATCHAVAAMPHAMLLLLCHMLCCCCCATCHAVAGVPHTMLLLQCHMPCCCCCATCCCATC